MLKDAIEDECKMQELVVILDDKGFKKSADTIDSFRFDLWNYKSFPRSHWKRIRTTNVLERVKRRQRTHAASGGASEALPHEVGARPSRSEPKLNTHALYPSRSELRGITFKNKSESRPEAGRKRKKSSEAEEQ